ncbi:nibrin isoform X2 [Malaya genurostris]|uniref:nibrin isoform X2 n=1 Tax=Malaya genurostris TaxID=325434 RepID=UPI0026F40741|nr:nibrin isoform X2 [Malaya genurostris]
MWFLKNLNSDAIYYIRPEKPKHTVSRSVGELIIQGDQSISRNHAFLYPEPESLKLIDAGSRYGTFLNDNIAKSKEKLPKDVPVELKENDKIRFGMCQSVWRVGRVDFVCITSTISVSKSLQEALQKLGGRVEDTFQPDVTRFLIMNSITTTTKLLMCLISGIPIVKPEYFEKCLYAVEKSLPFPDADRFIPDFTESYIRRDGLVFTKVPARQSLFNGKVFIFMKLKNMSKYESIIKLAGGICFCAQKRKIAKSFFIEPHVIVIQPFTDSLSQASSQVIEDMMKIVTNAGRRLIPDTEIGLAILVCSLEKYCNPTYKFANVLDVNTVSITQGDLLAKNSVDQAGSSLALCSTENVSIPDTESRDSSQNLDLHKVSSETPKDYGDQPLKGCEVVSEFVEPSAHSTAIVVGKRKRVETTTSPAKEVKKTRSETSVPESSTDRMDIPETPASNLPTSQISQLSGFLSVNHRETTTRSSPPPEQSKKRPLLFMLDDNDDDLFNFGDTIPKRTKRQPTLMESFSASQSQRNRSTRNGQDENEEEKLFAFEESNRTRSKEKSNSASISSLSNSSTVTSGTKSASYQRFIKPIHIPDDRWMTSTFCDLSIKPEDDHPNSVSKTDPDGDDVDQKTRVWFDGMEAMFQVQIKCMNLTSHRPGISSAAAPNYDSRNFKAFTKTRFRLFSSRTRTTNRRKR